MKLPWKKCCWATFANQIPQKHQISMCDSGGFLLKRVSFYLDIVKKLVFYFFSKRSVRGNRAFSSFSHQNPYFWLFHSWPKEKHPFFVFFKLSSEVRAARRTIFHVFPRSRAVCGSIASKKIILQKFSSLSPSATESDFWNIEIRTKMN